MGILSTTAASPVCDICIVVLATDTLLTELNPCSLECMLPGSEGAAPAKMPFRLKYIGTMDVRVDSEVCNDIDGLI